jgi:hypothetical protein
MVCRRHKCEFPVITERVHGEEVPLTLCQTHYDLALQGIREFFGDAYEVNDNGCWIWIRGAQQQGYGMAGHRGITTKNPVGGTVPAYQMALFLTEDNEFSLAEMGQIHHLCGDSRCVNPAHLVELREIMHQVLHNLENLGILNVVLDHIAEIYPDSEDFVKLLRNHILGNE